MRKGIYGLSICLFLFLLLGGCGGSSRKFVTKYYAYAISGNDHSICVYNLDPTTGILTLNSKADCLNDNGFYGPIWLTVNPAKKVIYATVPAKYIWTYRINQGGSLTKIDEDVTSAYSGIYSIGPHVTSVTPNGKYLYVSNHGHPSGIRTIGCFTINNNGTLGSLTETDTGSDQPSFVKVNHSGNCLYIIYSGGKVQSYTINSTGGLINPSSKITAANADNGIALSQDDQYVFVNGNVAPEIYQFKNGPALDANTPPTFAPYGTNSTSHCIFQVGGFLFRTNFSDWKVYGMTINNTDGTLSNIAGFSYTVEGDPICITADPDGNFLYVLKQSITKIMGYTINNDGTLTAIPEWSGVDTDSSPTVIATAKVQE